MAHAHHHHGESMKDYFTEQLLTLLVCGVFGFVGIQLYLQDRLANLLSEQFQAPIMWGGVAIIVMVVFRMIAVWKEAGEYQHAHSHGDDCGPDHNHGPDCNHVHIPGDEDDEEADHGHSHDLSWVFARMLILVFPLALFFMGLPRGALSAAEQARRAGIETSIGAADLKELAKGATVLEEKTEGGTKIRKLKTSTGLTLKEVSSGSGEPHYEVVGGEAIPMRFNELNQAAYDPAQRDDLQGRTIVLEGRFKRLADHEFSLMRMKMTCCAADITMLKVRIIVPQSLSGFSEGQWVRVKGQLQFIKMPGKDQYVPTLMVSHIRDVEEKPAPNNEAE